MEIMLSEHDCLRRTIDGMWNREATLINVLILSTGASLAVIVPMGVSKLSELMFPAALLSTLIAGSIHLQYWSISWYQGYIKEILRPCLLKATSTEPDVALGILGFEDFARAWKARHWGLWVTVGVGSLLQAGLLVLPSVAFLALGLWDHLYGGAPWHHVDVVLLALCGIALALLVPAIFVGYWANNTAFRDRPAAWWRSA